MLEQRFEVGKRPSKTRVCEAKAATSAKAKGRGRNRRRRCAGPGDCGQLGEGSCPTSVPKVSGVSRTCAEGQREQSTE